MNRLSERVDTFVDCFNRHSVTSLIPNLTTRVERLDIAELSVPITINDGGGSGNCYVCDPITGYIDYAIEETRNFVNSPVIRNVLVGLIRSMAPVVRSTGLDRSVAVNNWLFSTNPAPQIDKKAAAALRDQLTSRYPGHAIIVRSLNTFSDPSSLSALKSAGFTLLPSRQIYLFDGGKDSPPSRDMKQDRVLLRKSRFKMVQSGDFSQGDYVRCAELYKRLYIEKYTPLNPQYLSSCIAELHQRGVIQLEGLRDEDGRLVAVGGRFQIGKTLTQPILGYDTTRPQKDGLYRLITAMAQQAALDQGLLFNMSAGAAEFKRNRCAFPAIEYSAVYTRHLSQRRNVATHIVAGVLAGVGVPILKRSKL